MSARRQAAIGGAALLAPLVLFPLVADPLLAIAAAVVAGGVALAWRSPAWPVAFAGVPTILVGIFGAGAFPNGLFALSLAAWTVLALVFVVARDGDALPFRALASAPVAATVALAVLLLARYGASQSHAYGSVKLRLFVAQNLVLLLAGMAIARRRSHLLRLLAGVVAVGAATALVLTQQGLSVATSTATVGGRFSLDQADSPIGLGRDAAEGILVAVFLVVAAVGPPLLRLLALAAVPLLAVSFVAAGSRGPVVGLLAGLVVLLALTLRAGGQRGRVALVVLAGTVAAFLVGQLVPGPDVQRAFSVLGGGSGLSSNGRYALWHQAWSLFAAHPLLGIGTGGFAAVDPVDLYPHNIFLELGAEVGILGPLLVLAVVAGAVVALVRAARLPGAAADVPVVAALLVAAFLNAQVSSDVTTNAGLWLAAGLALGLARRPAEAPR